MQLPWIPAFVGLESRPFHDTSRFAWARNLEASAEEIRKELHQVQRDFGRAAYDSDRNVKIWKTFYFHLNGRPVKEHLDACPRTTALSCASRRSSRAACYSRTPGR
jgi:aspartyl/asparaginyl beta-hydroxylase (cupin superfamily)